jgi:hypothetical protein
MVTISNVIQLQQTIWGIDANALALDVDLFADLPRQRDQDFSCRSLDRQPAGAATAIDAPDSSDRITVHTLHQAPGELMMIKAPRRQGPQFRIRDFELAPGQFLRGFNAVQAVEMHDWTAPLDTTASHGQVVLLSPGPDPKHRSHPESFLHEIRFRVDDDVPTQTVGTDHATHQHQRVPIRL